MSDAVRVAAIQMNCHLADVTANLAQAETLLMEVAGRADVACLPELFKYLLLVLGAYADAVVNYCALQQMGGFHMAGHPYPAASGGEFVGVGEEVKEYLPHLGLVGE